MADKLRQQESLGCNGPTTGIELTATFSMPIDLRTPGIGFGYYIRNMRRRSGKTIDAIAGHLNMTRNHLMNIERGVRPPFRDNRIADFVKFVGEPDEFDFLLRLSIIQTGKVEFNLKELTQEQSNAVINMAFTVAKSKVKNLP